MPLDPTRPCVCRRPRPIFNSVVAFTEPPLTNQAIAFDAKGSSIDCNSVRFGQKKPSKRRYVCRRPFNYSSCWDDAPPAAHFVVRVRTSPLVIAWDHRSAFPTQSPVLSRVLNGCRKHAFKLAHPVKRILFGIATLSTCLWCSACGPCAHARRLRERDAVDGLRSCGRYLRDSGGNSAYWATL